MGNKNTNNNSSNEFKTKSYQLRANQAYRNRNEQINVILSKGTKDRIKNKYGDALKISAYIQGLIDKDLNG